MIASDEPWVRQPVVLPGAWNRSASIRTQRCSISAEIGYSAWSMKLRWRFSAMIRCASGSIQVVTNVARLRCGSPSMARSSPTSRMASVGRIPLSGKVVEGADSVRNRLPKSASAAVCFTELRHDCVEPPFLRSGFVECLDDSADREAHRTCERPPVDQSDVDGGRCRRARERSDPGEEEQHRADLVDRDDPPAELVDAHADVAVAHIEQREVSRDEEADAAEDVGQPDPTVGLSRREPFGKGRHQADREQQSPDEQHDRTQPAGRARPGAPPAHPRCVDRSAHVAGVVDDEQDRHVAAEAEEEAPDQVSDVDRRQAADPELGEVRAESEE